MNMDTTVIAAGPLVTEHLWALSPAVFIGFGLAAMGVMLLITAVVTVSGEGHPAKRFPCSASSGSHCLSSAL